MNLTIILIMIAVLIVLPIIFARMSGRNPMEMFFGSRVNDTSFAGEKTENEKKAAPKGREKNSTKNDIMVLISRVLTYARRNRFYAIVPGTVTIGDRTASLAAIVVTRGCVLGVNRYGFGGSIEGKSGSSDWVQTLNGERKSFPSPTVKNEEQRKILADVLTDAGCPEVDAQVVGVFTEPKVRFTKVSGKGCYTMDMFRDFLASDTCMRSKDLDPSEIGKKLEAYVMRAKS
jgi:hypothetical protein